MSLKNSLPQVNALQIRQYCFYSCPYRVRLFVNNLYPGRCPRLWRTLGFQPAFVHSFSFQSSMLLWSLEKFIPIFTTFRLS